MNLFIGNLNPVTTEEKLRTLFSEFGEIISVKIPVDAETGLPRGFGFVEMTDKFEAMDAIDNIDGTYQEGNVITVKESRPKGGGGRDNRRGGGGNFRRNSFNDRGSYRGRQDDSRGGYQRRSESDDPNRQPGRRFSPRGPRPGSDN